MNGQSGMTLLEVLVGLMVLALTGLLLSGAFTFGQRAWSRGPDRAEPARIRIETAATLRNLIAQAAAPVPGSGTMRFSGEPDRLTLATHHGLALGGGRPREVEIYRDPTLDTLQLRIAGEERPLMLIEGISSLRFRYFGRDSRSAETWAGQSVLPRRLEAEIDFADGQPPLWLAVTLGGRYAADCVVLGRAACAGARP
ncbi:PulJ/GspJ family protein [Futiania mangrovi]|uniref:Prepilin-type N-terminal cleavage/methylation domain-containing protein n=1 Tax=Futiania mangrovi TaxID=2959716 RepID=A0A9J6PEM8_9PROT|nr:prepilin-type N-terminal cleavage/methylation domain-containing protein [Futiania mangrovii]MCP1337877.1 prepilin-type N-terminal cleavage/methylation domain-containing protein [Futiania mangrovii]